MKSINTEEIEKLFALIIMKLKADDVKTVEFDLNEYWIILADEWNNFDETPQPGLGSLSEDIDYLKEALKRNDIFSYSDFDRLASVLRAISEMMAPSTLS